MNDVAPVAARARALDFKAEAHRDPWSVPVDEIDVSNPYLYSDDTWHGFFARLRRVLDRPPDEPEQSRDRDLQFCPEEVRTWRQPSPSP